MRLNNLPNELMSGFPDFDRTPKSVIAAIAVSFAALQSDGDFEKAKELIRQEWFLLHQGRVVPQKPPKAKKIEKAIEESY
jgi:hypothetical protein